MPSCFSPFQNTSSGAGVSQNNRKVSACKSVISLIQLTEFAFLICVLSLSLGKVGQNKESENDAETEE
jgi:hypothetical protein